MVSNWCVGTINIIETHDRATAENREKTNKGKRARRLYR
jgi:hypothetical protein